jgi:hypothetical protein
MVRTAVAIPREDSGVPYEQQQTPALTLSNGILALPKEDMAALAQALRYELQQRGFGEVSFG